MKKIIAVLLVICFCVGLCACGNTESITNSEASAVWKVEYKTDDFGEPIGIPYLVTEIGATYDTKNTENKQARITLSYHLYETDGFIDGYFSMSAKVGSNDAKKDIRCPATVKLKINDQVYEEWLKIPGGYDVYFYENDSDTEYIYSTIYDALISGTDVQMVFDDYDHTKYKFTIESGNFKEVIAPILTAYLEPNEDESMDSGNDTAQNFTLEDIIYTLKDETLQYPSGNEEWKYDVYESYIAITAYIGNSASVVIPSELEGLPVKFIEPSFRESKTFDEIKIPESIIHIRINAFNGMPVKRVTFESDNLIIFEEGVFKNCTMLEDMDSIVSHIYGNKIPARMFSAKYLYTADEATYERDNLDEEVLLPENITVIGEEAFCGLSNLKSINLENIISVENESFANCDNLQNADFTSLTMLGKHAFSGCTALPEIILYSVSDIPEGAFYNCKAQTIDLGNAEMIGENSLPRTLPVLIVRNPSCDIGSAAFGYLVNPLGNMIIYGHPASTAAEFASEYDCIFKKID